MLKLHLQPFYVIRHKVFSVLPMQLSVMWNDNAKCEYFLKGKWAILTISLIYLSKDICESINQGSIIYRLKHQLYHFRMMRVTNAKNFVNICHKRRIKSN